MRSLLLCCLLAYSSFCHVLFAQNPSRTKWADSVLQSLSPEERIAQLMVIRTSSMDAKGQPIMFDSLTFALTKQYNIGAVCLFQGSPAQQAALLNQMQQMAKTPVMVTVDGEWGLGMRFAGVKNFPYQLTMGALPDAELVYKVGRAIADQCKRMNIHVNYAPVVDINNNPANPVIGVRSFGEDKYKVALMGTRIMKGMQDQGVMACAKHFPGHGDVSVDSHYDLPVINKDFQQLTDLELYPFKTLFSQGIGSVMVAHLSIPAIDTTANRPTSLSYNNITRLMRNELDYQGLTFTDALEMKGVAKFYPSGEAAVQSLIAGNDMLCLPADVAQTIDAVKAAIAAGRLNWQSIDDKCRRVLEAKYDYVLGKTGAVMTDHLLDDLNKEVDPLRKKVAEQALTVLQGEARHKKTSGKMAYVVVGPKADIPMAKKMKGIGVPVYHLLQNAADSNAVDSLMRIISAAKYSRVVVGMHGITRSPARNFGYSDAALKFVAAAPKLAKQSAVMIFGNPYAAAHIQAAEYSTKVVCYEDDSVFQSVGYDWLQGRFAATGKLPVTVGNYSFGTGNTAMHVLEATKPASIVAGLQSIDTVAAEAIAAGAAPGCVVAVLKDGKLVYHKAYGTLAYDQQQPVQSGTIYDLASVTKVSATTVAVMKLYEEGKLDITKPIGDYLSWLKGTDKEGLTVENLLLHQAGLNAFIPFYREAALVDSASPGAIFRRAEQPGYEVEVSNTMFMRRDWVDTMYGRIGSSKLNTSELKYVYSDNDFILLGKIVESVSGMPLEQYVRQHFYEPLGMHSTGFRSYQRFALDQIAPTEKEIGFRKELIWGYVHDPGAAMFGNVAGHAGLFSNAIDLAILYQMLLNGGSWQGKQYFRKSTVDYFTSYQTPISRRGLGFDKPEKNNAIRQPEKTYPARYVSPKTFGHTGFTGTCVWADPANKLVYVFLSNRVNPQGGDNRKLLDLNIRGRIHDIIYQSLVLPKS